MTQTCSAMQGRLDDVQWYMVPGVSKISTGSRDTGTAGAWYAAGNRIVLAGALIDNGELVRHEMLHALLQTPGPHSRLFFHERCGGFVSCIGTCARDVAVDSAPREDAIPADLRTLEVQTTVVPESVSIAHGTGWFSVDVTVRNPFGKRIWARLSTVPGNSNASTTFGYTLSSGSGNSFWISGDSLDFAPNEIKRRVFDVSLRQEQIIPGAYLVRGFFNTDSAAPARLIVRP